MLKSWQNRSYMITFKEIYQQIVRQQSNKDDDNLPIVQRRLKQKAKIRDDEKTIEYEENGTTENKEKYVSLDRNYKSTIKRNRVITCLFFTN